MYSFAIADPHFLEGQSMIDLFLMLLHLYFCQIFISDLFLGNIGFLPPKYMKKLKLEFLAADFMFFLNLVDYYFEVFFPQLINFRFKNNLVENLAEMASYTYSTHLIVLSLLFQQKMQNNWRFLGTLGTCF